VNPTDLSLPPIATDSNRETASSLVRILESLNLKNKNYGKRMNNNNSKNT
jgi:hypothetical protein